MIPTLILSESDYQKALARINDLMGAGASPSTPVGRELKLLVDLVGRYEDEKFPIDPPDGSTKIDRRGL
jgi:HTH-type transcriptional regulator/antitoxin HigA